MMLLTEAYRPQDALTLVTSGVAIAQLDGLVTTGGSAGGDDCPAHRSALQPDVDFDGGVATGIQYLPGMYSCNMG